MRILLYVVLLWRCVAATKYHLLTYATASHAGSAARLVHSARAVGGFDEALSFGPTHLDAEYKRRNARILKLPRGAGYWAYKPYIIMRYMYDIASHGDIVCYMDSLYEFKKPFTAQVDAWLATSAVPIALTVNKPDEVTGYEKQWTKKDTFTLIGGVGESSMRETLQAWCGFICFRNTYEALQYVAEWYTYCTDARIVTDAPSVFGAESPDFEENRHDQSVCSLLAKKYNVTMHAFPSGPVFNHHFTRKRQFFG
jgi:hypothetical protein